MKSIDLYDQFGHYGKYGMDDRQSAHPSYWYKSECIALTWCIITLCFTSSSLKIWLPFQAKNNVRRPTCTALTKVSHQSHNVHTANRHLRSKGERNGVQRRTKVSFGRTMMQALELLRLAKRHISGWSDIEQWRNQACSYSHYRVSLVWRHQGGRESVSTSQPIENSTK